MKKSKTILIFMLLIILFSFSCSFAEQPDSLTAAIFKYIPDPVRFETAIREEWNRRHPDIALKFVDWDCYDQEIPNDIDVFIFDAIYLDHYIKQGALLPIHEEEIENKDDLIPYALNAAAVDGVLYAVPQFLCTNLLYTRKNDTDLADANDIDNLYQVIGELPSEKILLPENEGLLVQIASAVENFIWYILAFLDYEDTFPEEYITFDPDWISAEAIDSLEEIREMAGTKQLAWMSKNNAYIRAEWFARGRGRAYIGYSEAMSVMGDALNDIDFRRFSFTDGEGEEIPIFFADMTGINAQIRAEKQPYAIELLNVITGTDVMVQASSPSKPGESYQYLLSARESVYDTIGKVNQVYNKLKDIISDPKSILFIVRDEDLQYLDQVYVF